MQNSIKATLLAAAAIEEGWVVGDIHGRLVNARNLPQKRFHHVNVGLVVRHTIIALGTKYRSVRRHFPDSNSRAVSTQALSMSATCILPPKCDAQLPTVKASHHWKLSGGCHQHHKKNSCLLQINQQQRSFGCGHRRFLADGNMLISTCQRFETSAKTEPGLGGCHAVTRPCKYPSFDTAPQEPKPGPRPATRKEELLAMLWHDIRSKVLRMPRARMQALRQKLR